jgi:hypothetical protein
MGVLGGLAPYLLTHIVKQSIVKIINTNGTNRNKRTKDYMLIALNIFEQKDEMKDSNDHDEKGEH